MEEKEPIKIKLSTVIFIIIVIALVGVVIYFVNQNNILVKEQKQISNKMQTMQQDLEKSKENVVETQRNEKSQEKEEIKNVETQKNDYISNFSKSVSKELDEDNTIYIQLSNVDRNNNYDDGYVSINNKHEARIYLKNFKEYSSASKLKKIADNVVNAWYCEQGQVGGDNYIVFLKENGTVTYVRFRTSAYDNKTKFESEEKTLKGVTNISNIIPIEGNDYHGIGGLGVLLIKTDGTCLHYSALDDLAK